MGDVATEKLLFSKKEINKVSKKEHFSFLSLSHACTSASSRQRLLAITRESFKRRKGGGGTADKVSPTPEMQIRHNGEDDELSLWPPKGPARDFQDLISPQKSIISAWQLASAQKGGRHTKSRLKAHCDRRIWHF